MMTMMITSKRRGNWSAIYSGTHLSVSFSFLLLSACAFFLFLLCVCTCYDRVSACAVDSSSSLKERNDEDDAIFSSTQTRHKSTANPSLPCHSTLTHTKFSFYLVVLFYFLIFFFFTLARIFLLLLLGLSRPHAITAVLLDLFV